VTTTRVLHDTREPGIPIISMQAVVAVVLGGIILGEEDLLLRLVAAGTAVVGVVLIALG